MATSPSSPLPSSKEDGNEGAKKQNEAKKCGVCGDRALGYNFNAITCESCKAFFRRNALKNKEFKCPFQDQCHVDQVTRRFCQKCRLRKCFEIGMKKEWIMTDEEKKKKKQKIEENRARKLGEAGHDDDDYDDGGGNSQHSNNNNDNNNNDNDGSNDGPASLPPSSPAVASLTKPQAVVVGVIREGDSLPPKVARTETEASTDHHTQLHPVIRDYQTECSSSSPLDSLTKLREGESSLLAPGLPSPATIEGSEGASNPCLAEVFAISIKKEVEYMDDQASAAAATALHNHHHHHSDPHTQSPLLHHQHKYQFYHNPLPPHSATSPHSEPLLLHTSPHHTPPPPAQLTPPSAQHTPPQIHSTSPLPQPHHSVPPHHHNSSETQTDSEECGGFSIREAMEILHPEDKDSKESSSVMDTLMNTAIRAEYSSPLLSLHLSPPSELNEAERAKLEELTEANKGLLAPLCEDYNFKTDQDGKANLFLQDTVSGGPDRSA